MSRGQVLWGVPPYEGWTGGAIRIEAGTRANYETRKREGWTHLRIWPEGEPGVLALGCVICYATPGGKHLASCNGATLGGEVGE